MCVLKAFSRLGTDWPKAEKNEIKALLHNSIIARQLLIAAFSAILPIYSMYFCAIIALFLPI